MACKSCGSDKQNRFRAGIAIHFPGLKGLEKPHVMVFPELLVCLSCGNAEFDIPETELRLLANGGAGSSCEEQLPNFLIWQSRS
jgi:hypothetical protein